MRVHVALTPAEFGSASLAGRAALVVDVFRATTSVVAACAAGCRAVIPVSDTDRAAVVARGLPPGEALLAGERGGEPIDGFDLGNSPLEFVPGRVRDRTIVLTTTNGTRAMLAAAAAATGAVAALTNLEAAAQWAAEQGRDVTILCAGEKGELSLEDTVCAGLLVDLLVTGGAALQVSDGAMAARRVGQHYGADLSRLREDSTWARKLDRAGRAADLAACIAVASVDSVPRLADGVVVPDPRLAGAADPGGLHGREARR
jgi:2-phosphosulfolactate phosphatase